MKHFFADKSASMATQVVVFSVMLFGMSGVVLDFGRVYNEHSRMQAFTDQAALAAARQLDRKLGTEGDGSTNSIKRAVDAVFDAEGNPIIQKAVSFGDDEDGDLYRISHLFFLRELSDDVGEATQFGDDLVGGNMLYMYTPGAQVSESAADVVAAATLARYVIAVGEERSLRNTLMNLVSTAESSEIENPQSIRTVSIAEVRQVTTAGLSNFAVCNPWEGNGFQSAASALATPANAGMHFHLGAYGATNDHGLTQPNALAVLDELQGVPRVRQICGDPLTLPGFDPGMSQSELEAAVASCMLAASVQTEVLIEDDVLVDVADPGIVTTSLNTVFDLWDEPIVGVLDWDTDASGRHSQDPDFGGASHPLESDSALFQPALNIMKGRVRDEALAAQFDAVGRPRSSRLNYPRTNSTSRFETLIHQCIRPDNGLSQQNCFTDPSGAEFVFTDVDGAQRTFVSGPITSFQLQDYYVNNFPGHVDANPFSGPPLSAFTSARGIEFQQLTQWGHHNAATAPQPFSFTFPPAMSFQGFPHTHSGEDPSLLTLLPGTGIEQEQMRRCVDSAGVELPYDPTAADPCIGVIPQNADGTETAPVVDGTADDLAVIAPETDDREPDYSNFTWQPIDPADWNEDRRLFDVTLVNCGTATQEGGALKVEVEAFAQMYLLAPPRVTCPDGTENCANDQIDYVDLYMEFAGDKDYEREFYAVLVR